MKYIQKITDKDEQLIFATRPHWIYVLEGLLWFLAFTAVGLYVGEYMSEHQLMLDLDFGFIKLYDTQIAAIAAFSFIGFCIFLPLLLSYVSSEVGLTSKRIIYKRGFFFIQVEQITLEDVDAEYVSKGWLGWILGYGRIRLDCRFIDDIWLPAIHDPYKLVRAIHKARVRHPKILYDHNDLSSNLELIEQRKQQALLKTKIAKLKQHTKLVFKKVA